MLAATFIMVVAGESVAGEPVSTEPTSSGPVAAGDGTSNPAMAERGRGRKRPGCGRFCSQAGGFGAGPEPEVYPVDVPRQTIDAPRKRIVGITATCNLDEECVGAIILDSLKIEYGRANLRIPAHTTKTVFVGLTRKAFRYLKKRDSRKAFATVPLIDEDAPVSFSGKLTLLAP